MRRVTAFLTLVLPLLTACGGGAPPGPPSLSYDVPREPTVAYVQGDTSRVEVDAGGQMMELMVSSGMTLGFTFARSGDGLEVTTTIEDYSAIATNPMGPPQGASASDVTGSMIFTLDRQGNAALVESPELKGLAEQFLTPAAMVAGLFPRLPGRAVGMGESWTDTIAVDAQQAAGFIKSTSVVTYTVAGNTVVAGRSLLRVTLVSEDEAHTEGSQAGFDVVQDLSGESSGYFLWDLTAGILYQSASTSDLSGTMSVSAAPFPMSVNVRSTSAMRLKEGM